VDTEVDDDYGAIRQHLLDAGYNDALMSLWSGPVPTEIDVGVHPPDPPPAFDHQRGWIELILRAVRIVLILAGCSCTGGPRKL
jgi:hypothetical protein